MRHLGPALLSLLLLALTAPAAHAVVGGAPASRAAYPFFVEVGPGGEAGSCGGALIAPDRVLTAAHCRETVEAGRQVRVGPKNVKRKVVRLAIDPLHVRELAKMEREFPPPAADLMLLDLDRSVTGVPLLPIATAADGLTAPGTPAVTIGTGASVPDGHGGGTGAGTFRAGTVAVQNQSTCRDALGTKLLRTWSICTRDPRTADPAALPPFVSACVGDSGGPLLAGPATAPLLIGTVSWGADCGAGREPELYANAVEGRDFALDRTPAWAPQAVGPARLVGVPKVGRTLRCVVRWLVKPTRDLDYGFAVDGFQKQSGRRDRFRLRSAYRGKKVTCTAGGVTDGGRGGPPGLSRALTVR